MNLQKATRRELIQELLALRERVAAFEGAPAGLLGRGGAWGDPGRVLDPLRDHGSILYVFEEATLRIVDANRAAEIFYGYPREQFLRMRIPDLNAVSEEKVRQELAKYRQEGKNLFSLTHRLASGELRDVEVRSCPVSVPQGVFYVSVVTDVTECRKAEDAHQASEDKYRTLLRAAPQGIAEWDTAGIILRANPAYARIHGMRDGEPVGLRIWDVMEPGPKRDAFPDYVRSLVEHQPAPLPYFYRGVTKAGGAIEVRMDWNYLRDRHEALVGFVSVLSDITAERRAEEALRRSEERWRLLVEQAPEAIVVYDAEANRFVDANANAKRLFGCCRRDLREGGPQRFYRPVQPDGRPIEESMRENVSRALAGEQVIIERAIRTGDGRDILCEVRLARLLAGNRRLIRASYLDVTAERQARSALRKAHDDLERRVARRTAELEKAKRRLELDIEARKQVEAERDRLETELRRSQTLEAVGRLAGGVAHEFNNLLGGLLGCLYVAGLEAGAGRSVRVREELERAGVLCKRGAELTRQLLKVARSDFGRPESIAVEAVLDEVRLILDRTLPSSIRLEIQCQPGLPRVRGVASSLVTALLNLGINGRDAMVGGGVLSYSARALTGRRNRKGVFIEVSDCGAGVPDSLQEKIFEPFFTTKPPGEGTGLGLSLVYSAVKALGGTIRLRSGPGRGSTFALELPAEEEMLSVSATPLSPGGADHPLSLRAVLVVEDEEAIGRMMVSVLEGHGYKTLRASTGLEALECLRNDAEEIGLVVLDLILPGLGGEQVCRLLRSLRPELPVLLVSGRDDLAESVADGVPFLAKPFTADEFLASVGASLR